MKYSFSTEINSFIVMNFPTDGDKCGIIHGNINLLFGLPRMFSRLIC